LDILRELGQFVPVELAIAVGVELHRMLDEPLGRRWTARSTTSGPATTLARAAGANAALTGPTRTLALARPARTIK
jgi:hypothetical protein